MKTIEQLSVFLENRPGELKFLTQTLSDAQISIVSIMLVGSSDFGLARIIVDKPQKALTALKEKGLSVQITSVFGVELNDEIGSFNELLRVLSSEQINIIYCYSFYKANKGIFIFCVDDTNRAIKSLKTANFNIIDKPL